jgi:hypothetical protein
MKNINLNALFESYLEIMDKDRIETNNCVLVAHVVNSILLKQNINSEIAIGYACWSVGTGNNDILTHLPNSTTHSDEENSIMIHAWVEVGIEKQILDFTTYQFRKKAEILDAIDGLITNVEWCPNYLLSGQDKLKSLLEIQQSKHAGLYGYERVKFYEDSIINQDPYYKERIDKIVKDILERYAKSEKK